MLHMRQPRREYGTYKTVKARIWYIPDIQGQILALGSTSSLGGRAQKFWRWTRAVCGGPLSNEYCTHATVKAHTRQSRYIYDSLVAHIRQSRPDSVLGFQVKVLKIIEGVPFSLRSAMARFVCGLAEFAGGERGGGE